MDALRVVAGESVSPLAPCCRCGAEGCHWDRVNDLPYCPDCQESLVQGHADPLTIHTERRPCALCGHIGSVRFLTYPLGSSAPVEMGVCAAHFRALLARRLEPAAFSRLRRLLGPLGLAPQSIFLLHEAFYDTDGNALQPAVRAD
jgi:hypothetical protein